MTQSKGGITLDQPTEYEIEIQGRLEERWSRWFDDMTISVISETSGPAISVISGLVADQAALHGLLNRIRDLGIPLISVQLVTSDKRGRQHEP
ncbi:MAG TPA: hypothetical protein VFI27_02275 [candidate division Zixibacteria bacterium]|nr:hypothetical protein [candidate division Zixibacteria bacterium]